MHPEVRKFIEMFDAKMQHTGRNVKLNEIEIMFLQDVFGPEFSYYFNGLTAQLPIKDYKGSNRFIDFFYESGFVKIIIEIDGYHYHVEGLTAQQYDDHQERQNDMIISGGWILLRFTANMIMKKPILCRRQLMQAVGKSLVISELNNIASLKHLWFKRRSEILAIANHEEKISVLRVSNRFNVDRKTATRWLRRMVTEGDLTPIRANRYVTSFIIPNQDKARIP